MPDHLAEAGSVSHALLGHRIPLSAGQGILITLTVQQFFGKNTVFLPNYSCIVWSIGTISFHPFLVA